MKIRRLFLIPALAALATCGELAPDASPPGAPAARVESALLPTFVIRGEPPRRTSLADRMEALGVPG